MTTDRDAWKQHVGGFAWPTILLLVGVIALEAVAWSGRVPLLLGSVLATLAGYLAFTVMHEASHGNIHGRHRRFAKLGTVAGWVASATLFAPYPAFRVLHLRHHSYTNHPDKDPDYFVAGSAWMAPIRCLKTLPHYYREFLFGKTSHTKQARRERAGVLLGIAVYVCAAIGLTLSGRGLEVLMLWIVPSVLATALLALGFDWLPHHPHDTRERFHDTRIIDAKILDLVLVGQNLHLVHHLWPRVPFYKYRAAFEDSREDLQRKGAPIVTFGR
ncbi:MAG: fatty acid desaturase [Sandaracinaceae bacterium]